MIPFFQGLPFSSSRRRLFRMAAAVSCLPLTAQAANRLWSYEGENGPEYWSELQKDYSVCKSGRRQSPIDLSEAQAAAMADIKILWRPGKVVMENDTRILKASLEGDNGIITEKRPYALTGVKFHHPSEHAIAGKRFPMEIQFEHRSREGFLAIVAVLVEAGQGNAALAALWNKRFPVPDERLSVPGITDLNALLPHSRVAYRYTGSQTVPPCNEMVEWIVFHEKIEASIHQLEDFAAAFPNNARPLQPSNKRPLLLDLF